MNQEPANNETTNFRNELLRDFYHKGIRNIFIFGIALAVIWAVLLIVISQGIGVLIVNVIGFILSGLLFWLPMYTSLRLMIPGWLAFIVTTLLWGAIFIGLRSLILAFV